MTSEARAAISAQALERVAPGFRDPLVKFSKRLHALFGARLLDWTIYGPAAGGEQPTPARRALHVLNLDRIDLDMLLQLAPEGLVFGPAGLAAPLVVTPAYIETSLDAFPLEFIEIQQQHVTLLGGDSFAGLEFHVPDVRLACEREVKTLLLAMRQGLLSAGQDGALLAEVERSVAACLARLASGMAWLKGEQAFLPTQDRITWIETASGQLLPAAKKSLTCTDLCEWDEFRAFYDDIETLRRIIDAW